MKNFIIKGASDNIAEIDILGDIGEDWWTGEGNTLESVKKAVSEITANELIINVSSLGGDVNHGFAIHDMIRSLPIKTTAKVTGMTASAGTIVALGADTVEMSENAFFLIHNAWTGTMGNAKDHEKQIETLNKVDGQLVAIYKKKTGKTAAAIKKQMAKEEWMTASEAKEFGLIDKQTEAVKIAASVITNINESKKLPTINQKSEQMELDAEKIATSVFAKVKEYFATEKKTVSEEEITNAAKEQAESIKAELQAAIDEAGTKAKEQTDDLQEQITAKDEEIKELKGKLEKAGQSKTQTEARAEGNPDGEGEEDKNPFFNSLADKFQKKFGKRNQ